MEKWEPSFLLIRTTEQEVKIYLENSKAAWTKYILRISSKDFWSFLLDKLGGAESDGWQGDEDQVLWHWRVLSIQVLWARFSSAAYQQKTCLKSFSSRLTKSGIEHFQWVQPDSEEEEEESTKNLRARELFMSGDSTMVTVGGGYEIQTTRSSLLILTSH